MKERGFWERTEEKEEEEEATRWKNKMKNGCCKGLMTKGTACFHSWRGGMVVRNVSTHSWRPPVQGSVCMLAAESLIQAIRLWPQDHRGVRCYGYHGPAVVGLSLFWQTSKSDTLALVAFVHQRSPDRCLCSKAFHLDTPGMIVLNLPPNETQESSQEDDVIRMCDACMTYQEGCIHLWYKHVCHRLRIKT